MAIPDLAMPGKEQNEIDKLTKGEEYAEWIFIRVRAGRLTRSEVLIHARHLEKHSELGATYLRFLMNPCVRHPVKEPYTYNKAPCKKSARLARQRYHWNRLTWRVDQQQANYSGNQCVNNASQKSAMTYADCGKYIQRQTWELPANAAPAGPNACNWTTAMFIEPCGAIFVVDATSASAYWTTLWRAYPPQSVILQKCNSEWNGG